MTEKEKQLDRFILKKGDIEFLPEQETQEIIEADRKRKLARIEVERKAKPA